jgi:class 3 adenylate cyclase
MPMRRSYSASHLNIINDIVKESQRRIKRSLIEGFEYDHLVIAKSDEFLRKHVFQKLDFAVMYVDLVGSTRMSTELTPDFLSKIITVFSQEVAYVIERFQGLVLKFVGDAAIGYFPRHTFNVINTTSPRVVLDDIVLCGEAIVHVVRDAINPLLLQMGHRGIKVKVTSDYGQHTVVRYGSDSRRSHIDIISATMNLAAKMQSVAGGGVKGLSDRNDNGSIGGKGISNGTQMIIGKMLFERLSYDLQQIFEVEKFDKISRRNNSSHSISDGWTYHNLEEQNPYSLFTVTFPSGS